MSLCLAVSVADQQSVNAQIIAKIEGLEAAATEHSLQMRYIQTQLDELLQLQRGATSKHGWARVNRSVVGS